MNNQERIQRMTRKELSRLLCDLCDCGGCPYLQWCSADHNGAYVWLSQVAEHEELTHPRNYQLDGLDI